MVHATVRVSRKSGSGARSESWRATIVARVPAGMVRLRADGLTPAVSTESWPCPWFLKVRVGAAPLPAGATAIDRI